MRVVYEIKGKLPSLNEVINANRYNKYAGAKLKRNAEEMIVASVLSQGVTKFTDSVNIVLIHAEKTKRRDVDNVQSTQKFILDALVKCGVLKDDSPKYVRQVHHIVEYGNDDKTQVVITTNAFRLEEVEI